MDRTDQDRAPERNRGNDRRAREVLQAVAPLLRAELGVAELDPVVTGDLYVHVREALASGDVGGGSEPGATPDLALTIYLVLASHPLGSGPRPDLLVSLRQTLARSADSAGGATEVPSKGPERRDST